MQIVTDKNKVALYYKNEALTYKEFILNTKKIKQFSKIKEFTNNMIYMENRPELLYSFFAIWDSRATCVCIDASSTAEELTYYIDNSDVVKIFTTKMQVDKVKEALNILNKQIEIIIVDEVNLSEIKIDENSQENLVINSPEKEDIALILYTSGTTGKPKGVMLTFDNIWANVGSLDVYQMYEETDVFLALLPMHHILPLLGTGIMPLLYSATIVFLEDISSVALIDENTQKSLFGENENPIGKVILFNKKPLKIIGTVELNNVIGMNSSELNVFAPYTVVMNKVSGEKYIGSITVKVKDDIDSQVAQKSITDLLKAKHGKKDFFIMNTDTLKKTIESTTGTMKILISSIAVISLVVGGIGVMNIMLVSVTERTKEIGIRMAIGAKEKNILQQFLLEAVLICFIGGIVGIVLSLLIGWGFNSISKSFSMIFSGFSIVMAVLFSTLVGVIFGYMPAKNAAKLDPIEALSRE